MAFNHLHGAPSYVAQAAISSMKEEPDARGVLFGCPVWRQPTMLGTPKASDPPVAATGQVAASEPTVAIPQGVMAALAIPTTVYLEQWYRVGPSAILVSPTVPLFPPGPRIYL
jgi:hypothetical protein